MEMVKRIKKNEEFNVLLEAGC